MPIGRSRSRPRAADLRIDAREVEEEIRRNRESNEKFLREYSEWFERQSTTKRKGRKAG